MGSSHVDLSNENMMLGGLAKSARTVGFVLAALGIVATVALALISGGGDGHDDGHKKDKGAAHSTEHGDDHGHGDAHDDHAKDHGGEHHHAHGYVGEVPGNMRWVHPYLISVVYFLSITIGALFFIIIHHLVRAGWSTVLRRIAEAVSLNFVLMAILALPLLHPDVMAVLFKWVEPGIYKKDALIGVKEAYLNDGFFRIRIIAYFAIWIGFSLFYYRMSTKQDETGDPKLSRTMGRATPIAVLLFAISVSFAGFDLLMSLDAHWFSTMFGVYFFAGCVLSWHAFLALTVVWLQKNGRLTNAISAEHMQDVGKMVFAFTVFWAYVAFSQYMLYWYGNIPEETAWYLRRQEIFTWGAWGFFLVFGHFAIPFLFMLSKHVKRKKTTLAIGASWVLIVHWCDLYYIVMPQLLDGKEFPFHMMDVTIFLTVGGIYLVSTSWFLGRSSLLAKKDPRLPEALAFHNA